MPVLDRPAVNDTILISVPGDPRGKGRPRSRIAGAHGRQFVQVYTDADTRAYETRLRNAATLAMSGRDMLTGALEVWVVARFAVPKSWSNKRRIQALAGDVRPTGKPDWDNVGKVATDAFNGVVYSDDSQIVHCIVSKLYSDDPALVVTVKPIALVAAPSDLFNEGRAA